ncbi:DNA/RNA non-specific endonuclease [Ancylomarina sp. YFZ004]
MLSHTALLPNATYKITDQENIHWFTTDNLGRTIKTQHWVKAIYRQRLNDEQTKALMCKDEDTNPNTPRQINNEGGHILADSAGGLPESINIFPQAYRVNHSSEWRGLETSIKNAVINGANVIVETEFDYLNNCKRPTQYTYRLSINGQTTKHSFDNRNLTIEDLY